MPVAAQSAAAPANRMSGNFILSIQNKLLDNTIF